jgi:hypothetical protein
MRVLVGIPWRPQPHRVYAHDLVTAWYAEFLPDAHVVDVDTDHEPFCLAACRNKAVRLAEAEGFDVTVLGDADTLPESRPLLAAIAATATDTRVHLPYTEYRSLRRDGTAQFLDGQPLQDCNHLTVPFATSGIYVTTPAAWWACGGQDERFQGWAPEDLAWLICHRILLGAEPARHAGRVYALHHDAPPKTGPVYDDAVRLYHRYLDAGDTGDPDAIRALVAERADAVTCAKSMSSTDG